MVWVGRRSQRCSLSLCLTVSLYVGIGSVEIVTVGIVLVGIGTACLVEQLVKRLLH